MSTFRVLLSVHDKSGLVDFAQRLHQAGGELIASGGTARALAQAGLPVRAVEDLTHFPEILDGRVKTLHPAIHGGILARRTPAHLAELAAHDLAPIDLVVCNLYPFQQTVAQPNMTLAAAIEQIDIGGVTLLRAAAKNHEAVTVLCDPADYAAVATAFTAGGTDAQLRQRLALKAFQHTAAYDTAIAAWLEKVTGGQGDKVTVGIHHSPFTVHHSPLNQSEQLLPDDLSLHLTLIQRNRYGENPHQPGGFYGYAGEQPPFVVLQGKEMSYNNWLDLDAAWQAAQDFPTPTVAIIKHGNPCGLASAPTLAAAYSKALASDPVSAFGGIIATNRPLDAAIVAQIADLFVEVIVAPSYEPAALDALRKKKNLRLLQPTGTPAHALSLRSIYGGVLVQELDRSQTDMEPTSWRIVSQRQPTASQLADLAFAWRVARHVKSNAIIYVQDEATVGVGAGQMSRVDSVMLAGHKAGARAVGAVLASDAFFPFADGIEAAAQQGIVAVVQPGGSVRDPEVIATVDKLGLIMAFTGTRHFRH